MFVYSLSLECNVFQTSCGICKGRVHDLIVRQVKYEYVQNFIVVGCVCVQGVEGDMAHWVCHAYMDGRGGKNIYYMDDPLDS